MAATVSGIATASLGAAPTGGLVTAASPGASSIVVLGTEAPLFTATAADATTAPVVVVVTQAATPSPSSSHHDDTVWTPGVIAGIAVSGAAVVIAALALFWARRRKIERRRTMAFQAARARVSLPPSVSRSHRGSGRASPGPCNDMTAWRSTFHDHPDESAYDVSSQQASPMKDLHSPTFDVVGAYTRESHMPMAERTDAQPLVIDGRERDPFMRSPLSMIGGARHDRVESTATALSYYEMPDSPARHPAHPYVAAARPTDPPSSSHLVAPRPDVLRQSSHSSSNAEYGYAL